jgi:hypothetical protein
MLSLMRQAGCCPQHEMGLGAVSQAPRGRAIRIERFALTFDAGQKQTCLQQLWLLRGT